MPLCTAPSAGSNWGVGGGGGRGGVGGPKKEMHKKQKKKGQKRDANGFIFMSHR